MKHAKDIATTHRPPLPWAVLALAVAAGLPAAAAAQTVIQSISSSQQAGTETVRIELNEPLVNAPRGFVLQAPARIALDLQGVVTNGARSTQDINLGNLRSMALAQAGDRTRLVLNLRQSTQYRTEQQGKVLLVILEPVPMALAASVDVPPADAPMVTPAAAAPAVAASAAAASPRAAKPAAPLFADPQNVQTERIRDIDFRRGRDGAGRVVVDLPSTQVGVDIKQQGQNLVVDFLRSSVPDNLLKRLDVTDFGTPVQTITTSQVGDRVRMLVEPRGNWEHSAYQTDNQFVLEVRPQKVDPQKLTQGQGFNGDKLSLNFQSIDVRSLLQVIADFTNFNIVTSESVTGSVTLRLKDVPWDQALDIILQAKNLGVKKSGNVLWIAPKDELAAKEKQELEARRQIADLEPTRTQIFQLNYAKAEDVANALNGNAAGSATGASSTAAATGGSTGRRILSQQGAVNAERRTNQLFVTDVPGKLEEIGQLLAKIDVPVRQVMIEARIVEAEDSFGRTLGVKLGATDLRGINGGVPGWGGNTRVAIGGNYSAIGDTTLQQATGAIYGNSQFVNLPASTSNSIFSGAAASNFALALFGATSNRFLNLELSALEAEGKGKVVSSPRVVTADQVKALIEQGTELPYQTGGNQNTAPSIAFRRATLKLEVTPQITPEGNIIMDV
ncbi:MAG: type IV pilus secretin PilQ, partial [Leptothrix sp. (in: b-proteobacteria)]